MGRSCMEWMKSWVNSDRCPRLSIRVTYFLVETELSTEHQEVLTIDSRRFKVFGAIIPKRGSLISTF